jgi:hemerythrin
VHDIRHSVKIWLDDNMIHVTDEEKLLEVLEYFSRNAYSKALSSMLASVTSMVPKFATADAS